ncbi:10073_t:CDS:2 [Dentiscutata erythropus]|uniref:10073_t:CDS:1 n=1 Tax=Dentiscutata erythropus TaxID=1348616 RepID=A0A9N9AW05_9GLOM|nr:10073_t:CDS:2 [Dentiscutata erythropus]
MKNQSHNLRLMVITIFLLTLPTGFALPDLKNSTFVYSELSVQPNLTKTQPHILSISHYDGYYGYHDSIYDYNATVVRIGRVNYFNNFTNNYCYEQRLLLRVIQNNGSVIEIKYNDTDDEIQDINYCIVNGYNPIKIYPLFNQYILVTYTHAANTSDNTTFRDRGVILDWSGKNISTLDFGPSYLSPGTNNWIPYELIVKNIGASKMGLLRLSAVSGTNDFEWRHSDSIENFNLLLLQSDKIYNLTSFQVSLLVTNGEYAIIYTNTTIKTNNALAAQFIGIYAIMLNYMYTKAPQKMVLYELPTKDLTFTGLSCSVDSGQLCIASVVRTPTTNINATTTSDNFYVRIRLPSSGTTSSETTVSLDPMLPVNNGSLVTNVKIIPNRGYAVINRAYYGQNINFTFDLYDEDDKLSVIYNSLLNQIIANFDGAFDVLQNNTILMALNGTATSWKYFLFDLLPLRNLQVRAMYPPKNDIISLYATIINITFDDLVYLGANSNLTIYQTINQTNITRQIINGNNCCGCSSSEEVIVLKVPNYTFNDPLGQYFLKMDYGFVYSEHDKPQLKNGPDV